MPTFQSGNSTAEEEKPNAPAAASTFDFLLSFIMEVIASAHFLCFAARAACVVAVVLVVGRSKSCVESLAFEKLSHCRVCQGGAAISLGAVAIPTRMRRAHPTRRIFPNHVPSAQRGSEGRNRTSTLVGNAPRSAPRLVCGTAPM